MLGKAGGQARPHQPGSPLDHSTASSAKPLEPFRRLILRKWAERQGALSPKAGPSPPPFSFAAEGRSSQELSEGQALASTTGGGSTKQQSGSCGAERHANRMGVGDWFREHLTSGTIPPPRGALSTPFPPGGIDHTCPNLSALHCHLQNPKHT